MVVLKDRELVAQSIFVYADITRSSTLIASLRRKYLLQHPKMAPCLVIVDIDYSLCAPGQRFRLRCRNIRDAAPGFAVSGMLRAAMLQGSYHCVMTRMLDKTPMPMIVTVPDVGLNCGLNGVHEQKQCRSNHYERLRRKRALELKLQLTWLDWD